MGDCCQHGLILIPPVSHSHLKQCSVSYIPCAATTATRATTIDYPVKTSSKSFWVVGSCNRLVCISVRRKNLFLWNSSIKKCKKLPDIGMQIKKDCYMIFGFGYDELNDDYKVAGIFCNFTKGGSAFETKVIVYSLKNNSWNWIGDFKGGIPLLDSCECASGNLHWSATHGVGNWKIVSLNLANETYGEMVRPNSKELVDNWAIGALGGCLSVLYEYERNGVDVWVMKEYGVKDTWTTVVSISYSDFPGKLVYGRSKPLCFLRNGEVLLILHSVLVLYDPKSNTYSRCYPHIDECKQVSLFVESLVSPFIHDEEPRQI